MAKKASDNLKYYYNQGGPTIATVSRKVIEQDGLTFKDIDGTGEVTPVNDWRLSPAERAAAYVKTLTTDEKIAQLFISDWRMGPKYSNSDTHTCIPDESGVLDDATFTGKTIFGAQELPGTTTLIKDWFSRHLILRANPTPEDMADWLNQLHAVAEECERFVPVQVASNSRNENGEVVFGMNDASGVFAAPTLEGAGSSPAFPPCSAPDGTRVPTPESDVLQCPVHAPKRKPYPAPTGKFCLPPPGNRPDCVNQWFAVFL